MNAFSDDFITIADLYLAYKKAKAEAFFDNMHPTALAYADYEQSLHYNLGKLRRRLIKGDWYGDTEFIGD